MVRVVLVCLVCGVVCCIAACGDDDGIATPTDAGTSRDAAPDNLDAAPGTDATVGDGGPLDAPVGAAELWFEDVTRRAGVDLVRTPADDYTTIPDRMSGGVCVLDADGRAPLDLFFAVRPAAGSRSTLYVAKGPWDYEDETDERNLGDVGDAIGCLAFDADGDGDDDLLITGLGSLRLLQNDGAVFSDISTSLGFVPDPRDMYTSASAGDLDGDGDLDIVVAGLLRFDPSRHAPGAMCGPTTCLVDINAWLYIPDLLLLRGTTGAYEERAEELAPDLRRPEPGLAIAIGDLTEDGQPEIYVGNDVGSTYFDRALQRTTAVFEDTAEELGVAYNRRGYGIDTMGWATGDLDGDARLDHVATSFEQDATAVFICGSDGWCEDRAVSFGTPELALSFRWGPALADFDLDGDLDLVEATGHFFTDEEISLAGYARPHDQAPNLFENTGGGRLSPVSVMLADGLAAPASMRGIAVADLDDDGRPDVVLAPAEGPPRLLRNVRATTGHFLRIFLEGTGANRAALGARVTVFQRGTVYTRERVAGDGYLGNSDPRLLFGLPTAEPVSVSVTFRSGETHLVEDVDVDTEIVIRR